MAKIEVVKQRDLKDCGAASLLCIIKYYGGYVPIEKIRDDTLTTVNGTTAYHIINAAKTYGFEAMGVKVNNILDENIYLPAIAHLTLKNGLQHFVVVYKLTKNYVYLMDPARGKIKMKIEEFNALWTNVIILLNPITDILSFKNEITLANLFTNLLKRNKAIFCLILLINILLMIFSIIGSFYFQIAISSINNYSDIKLLKIIVIVFMFIFLFKVLVNFLRNYYLNFFHKNIDALLFSSFLAHMFNLPLRFMQNRSVGEIVSRVDELSEVKGLLSEVFTTIILNSILAIGTIGVLYFINTKLFFILCLVVSIYIIIGIVLSNFIYYHVKENIEAATDFNTTLVENVEMNSSIKNLDLNETFFKRLENKLILLLKNNFNLQELLNNILFLKDFIYEMGLFIILSFGIYLIFKGELSVLELVTFNSLILYLFEPVKEMINLVPKYNYLKASFSKISEFINIAEEDYNAGLDTKITSFSFCDVSYSYNMYSNTLNSINFEIEKKDKVLLSGPSGSGKSTICKLIYKIFDSNDGKIIFDRVNSKDINLKSIRRDILYIGQEEKLFTGTIKDNILCGRNVDNEKLLKVLDICQIEEIINKRPNRLETVINASLNNLSGGEKQRIILARGLLKNSNIIILDEALSEIDLNLEKKIIKAIMDNFKDQVLIYVSHKDVSSKFKKIIKVENNG